MDGLKYIQIDNPMTFEDILILWVGERCKYQYDDYLNSIRQVENQLDSALINNDIHLYKKRAAAGRLFFFEIPYNQAQLFSDTREGDGENLHWTFQFMVHHPNIRSRPSEPLYFDGEEISTQFPFLVVAAPVSDTKEDIDGNPKAEVHITAWTAALPQLTENKLTAAKLAIQKWQGKTHKEAFDAVCVGTVVQSKDEYVSKRKKIAKKIATDSNLTMPLWTSK